MARCLNCFGEYDEEYGICPHCGSGVISEPVEAIHLYPGTLLYGRYLIGQAIGSGGFGTIYKAWDSKLDTIIAIKEFFVSRLTTRAAGTTEIIVNKKTEEEFLYRKQRFLEEARIMAKFGAHRNIPNVFEFFEENKTAYIVMELLEGVALNEYLKEQGGKVDKDFALMITNEVGNALISLHEKGIIHRDVAPDNIFICSGKDIKIKLLDLGAAKLSENQEEVIDIVLKPGYSPVEQYDNTSKVGPWTDVYALGATLYAMLTGIKPDESTNRKITDEVKSPKDIDDLVSENLSNSIMKAMAVEKHMRFKSIEDFLKALCGQKKVISLQKEKRRRKNKRIFGIVFAGLIVTIGAGLVYGYYMKKEEEQQLPEATISIWYAAQGDSAEVAAMQSVKEDFESKYKNITIDLRRYDEEVYLSELELAAINNDLPSIFESTNATETILQNASDISTVLQSEQALSCLFLDNYSNKKQLPLAFEIPVAFVVTNGISMIESEETHFSDLSFYSAQTDITTDPEKIDFLTRCFGAEITEYSSVLEDFQKEDGKSAVLLSSSMNIQKVKKELLVGVTWHCAYQKDNSPMGVYTYKWSMGNVQDNEKLAAEEMLSWMLGNVYQNMLMVSRAQEGQLPINKTCLEEKCNKSTELVPILSVVDKLQVQE